VLDAGTLLSVAVPLLPAYVQARRNAAADEIADLLVEATGSNPVPDAAQLDTLTSSLRTLQDAPWLPPQESLVDLRELPLLPWEWGLAPIDSAANVVLQALGQLSDSGGARAGEDLDRGARRFERRLETLRASLHAALAELGEVKHEHLVFWRERAKRLFPDEHSRPDLGTETMQRLADEWRASFGEPLARVAERMATVLHDCTELVREHSQSSPRTQSVVSPGIEQPRDRDDGLARGRERRRAAAAAARA
jgi:hypothetical protein